MSALGGCEQAVESPHYDDYAPLHCLPEFVASDGIHFFVGVGVDIGIANVATQNFQVGLVPPWSSFTLMDLTVVE